MSDNPQPDDKQPIIITIDDRTITNFVKGFIVGYVGVYLLTILAGILFMGALLFIASHLH